MAGKTATNTDERAPAEEKKSFKMNTVQKWVSSLPDWKQQAFVAAVIAIPIVALAIILKLLWT